MALKVLVVEDGVTPSSAVRQEISFAQIPLIFNLDLAVHPQRDQGELSYIRRCGLKSEYDQVWSKVRHPNVLREFTITTMHSILS